MRILLILSSILHTVITAQPTTTPTLTCPRYWFTGGTSQNICATVGDRCSCHGSTSDECCLFNPDFNNTYDPNRGHKSDCKLDVYLLTSNKNGITHAFVIDILPYNYPCQMNIHWRLIFDCIDHNRPKNCETENLFADAGINVDVTSGKLKVWGQHDTVNTTVQFTVQQQHVTLCDSTRLDAIYGYLEIVNATSECQPDCPDYRLYPMRIPVYYTSSQNPCGDIPKQAHKNHLSLIWSIVGIVSFVILLRLLAWLFHWAEDKREEADLDVAVMQQEESDGNSTVKPMGKKMMVICRVLDL